jgi:hypothetical protein
MAVAPNPLTPVNEGPTSVYSDCLRRARHGLPLRRTREASSGWPSNGKALLGGMVARDGGRPSAGFPVDPCGCPGKAAHDGGDDGCRCGDTLGTPSPIARIEKRALPCSSPDTTPVGWWGGSGGPGVGDPRRAFASSKRACEERPSTLPDTGTGACFIVGAHRSKHNRILGGAIIRALSDPVVVGCDPKHHRPNC